MDGLEEDGQGQILLSMLITQISAVSVGIQDVFQTWPIELGRGREEEYFT